MTIREIRPSYITSILPSGAFLGTADAHRRGKDKKARKNDANKSEPSRVLYEFHIHAGKHSTWLLH
jgi:hypothetical protein